MATFACSLVTPERVLVDEEFQAVFLRTGLGEAAFMPGHTPLVGSVVPGVVRFQHEDGTEERAAVHGGFVQVAGDKVTVLAPVAELAAEIDVERARRALEAAGQRMAELGTPRPGSSDSADDGSSHAVTEAEEAQRRAEVRLEVAGAAAGHP
ncbi:MAG TPA: ATP synthase F1 subunit epsilon [Acidimicrobiales bacterium]|nr:ATP synthase F1 subunit epsilon [Acidimicrobiales bacterium]